MLFPVQILTEKIYKLNQFNGANNIQAQGRQEFISSSVTTNKKVTKAELNQLSTLLPSTRPAGN